MRISWQGRRSDKRHVDAHSTVCERRSWAAWMIVILVLGPVVPKPRCAAIWLGRSLRIRVPRYPVSQRL